MKVASTLITYCTVSDVAEALGWVGDGAVWCRFSLYCFTKVYVVCGRSERGVWFVAGVKEGCCFCGRSERGVGFVAGMNEGWGLWQE